MNAFVFFPSQLHWTAQQLTEAVPLRLHEMFAYDAGVPAQSASNASGPQRPLQRQGYTPPAPSPSFFRIR
jgi:hypothetical protein